MGEINVFTPTAHIKVMSIVLELHKIYVHNNKIYTIRLPVNLRLLQVSNSRQASLPSSLDGCRTEA